MANHTTITLTIHLPIDADVLRYPDTWPVSHGGGGTHLAGALAALGSFLEGTEGAGAGVLVDVRDEHGPDPKAAAAIHRRVTTGGMLSR